MPRIAQIICESRLDAGLGIVAGKAQLSSRANCGLERPRVEGHRNPRTFRAVADLTEWS